MKPDTIIIGGGLGGLSAAIHLACQGRQVVLFEKNERIGGKLNIVQAEGFTFDTGPSLLTMPWVIRDLFKVADRCMEDYLILEQIEPICRYFWPDGTRFDAWQRLPQLIQEITRINPPDVAGLFRFLGHTARIYDAVADNFILRPFNGLRELITPRLLRQGPQIDALRTVDQAVRNFFRSPYLRQVFNRYATYNGSSPYLAPATFNVIAYIEFAEGGWYVRGGMYTLGNALKCLAEDLGVTIHTNTAVTEILTEGGHTQGVRLACGEVVRAPQVVVNADPRYTYQKLLGGQEKIARRLARLDPSCSGFVLLLGVSGDYPMLAHHNIFFSQDYEREFAAIFQKGVLAPDPTIYLCITTRSDSTHAPLGHLNLFVLVNTPALNNRFSWAREATGYRDLIITKLERMGLDNLREHIVYEQMITPLDIEQRYNATRGAIYGLASNHAFTAFFRPPLRAPGVAGLYFVGGGTHPGGGIPLVLLSGRAVASQIAEDSKSLVYR